MALLSCSAAVAQEIQKSQTFVQLFGTKYYLHTMRSGETLDAIAKAYNTTVQEIKINNVSISNYQPGVVIRVPVMADNATPGNSQEFAYHTVEKKQTLYSICKKYGVTEDDIYKYNPQAKLGLKAGEVLKIPIGKAIEPDKQDIDFVYHTVKQNETFNSISQLYGVEISDIVKYNPQSKFAMKPGDIIRLPKTNITNKNSLDVAEQNETEIVSTDAVRRKAMEKSDYCPCENYRYTSSKTIKIALMLPLFINDNSVLSASYKSDPNKNSLKRGSDKIYEFYEGFLMAIKDFQMTGKTLQVNVYDTENSTTKTDQILQNPELKQMDIIIGPLYTENVIRAAKFANQNQIPMVSPFAVRNDLLKDNPYLFQFTPSVATSIEQTADYFGSLENASVIVVHNNKPNEIEQIKNYRDNLTRSYFSKNQVPDLIFKEVDFNNGGLSRVTEAMSPNKTNVILMPSTDEIFITKVINHLTNLQKNNNYKVVLFGAQSWEKYSNIDVEFLQSNNFCYRTQSFIDYENDRVKNFVSEFRDLYNAEPGIYGFSGYDIAKYFIGQLEKHGKYFQFCIKENSRDKGLVYKFDFKRVNPVGGFENRSTYVIKYGSDYTLQSAY